MADCQKLKKNCSATYFSACGLIVQSVSRIKISNARWLFSSQIWQLLNLVLLFEAAGAVVKIGLGLKPNHHKEI